MDNNGEWCLAMEGFWVSQTWGSTWEAGRGKDTLGLGGWEARGRRSRATGESGEGKWEEQRKWKFLPLLKIPFP